MSLSTLIFVIALGSLVAWKVGSIALRILGILFCIGATIELASPGAQSAWTAIAILVLGLILWLSGHWLFAFRHHFFRSALAQQIFMRLLPGWLDPTRRWNVITLDVEHH